MIKHHDHQQPDRRTRFAAAAITGFLAGLTRAIVGELLRHLLKTGC